MSGITKCSNNNCERKERCYRHTAPNHDHLQSFQYFNEKHCPYFWDNTENKENEDNNI